MERVNSYINKDLAFINENEFKELVSTPIPQNDNFIDNLEWALMYLNIDKIGSPIHYEEGITSFYHINTFDGAVLLNIDRLGSDIKNGIGYFNPEHEQATVDMFKDVNVKLFHLGTHESQMVSLQKYRIMAPKELRGIGNIKNGLEHRLAFLTKNGKWYTHEQNYNMLPVRETLSSKIKYAPIPMPKSKRFIYRSHDIKEHMKTDIYRSEVKMVNMSINAKLTYYYEWFVYIRENDKSLGIKIPILPEASKNIFNLRDLPEGQKRKKAICSFVKEHYRITKNEYNEEVRKSLIKEHFRGEAKFNWRGLQVNIIPSEYDLNRVKTKKKFISI